MVSIIGGGYGVYPGGTPEGVVLGGHLGVLLGSFWGPFWAPVDPPRDPYFGVPRDRPLAGPGGRPGAPGGAHFGGYLITLPVGTEWDRMGFSDFWPKSPFSEPPICHHFPIRGFSVPAGPGRPGRPGPAGGGPIGVRAKIRDFGPFSPPGDPPKTAHFGAFLGPFLGGKNGPFWGLF